MAANGITVLITTHFMDEAEFCGRIGFINAGRLIALDTPTGIKNQTSASTLEEAFIRLASMPDAKLADLNPEPRTLSSFSHP
jgi:ABC-type multidrug transport system ATPase subunit